MLLASDFDGTVFVSNKTDFISNIKAINEFRSKGNIFVIITGRGIKSIKEEIEKYNIYYDYLICENGAMIFDYKDNLIASTFLDKSDVLFIIDIINNNNYKYILDDGFNYITNTNVNLNSLACIYIEKKDIKNPQKVLKEILSITNTYGYLSKNYINIINKNINKLDAIKKLVNLKNIKSDIYTIGNAINDKEMITYYYGGIIKNHEKELDGLPNKNYDTLSNYIKELI